MSLTLLRRVIHTSSLVHSFPLSSAPSHIRPSAIRLHFGTWHSPGFGPPAFLVTLHCVLLMEKPRNPTRSRFASFLITAPHFVRRPSFVSTLRSTSPVLRSFELRKLSSQSLSITHSFSRLMLRLLQSFVLHSSSQAQTRELLRKLSRTSAPRIHQRQSRAQRDFLAHITCT